LIDAANLTILSNADISWPISQPLELINPGYYC